MIKQLRELKKGDYFTLKEISEPAESQVYIRGDYDKASKTFSVCKFSNTNNERFLKADKKVYIDFTF